MAACRPCTRLLWTERYDPHAVGLSRSASHAEASKFQGERTALHTSERAVEHWLKTLSTGSRNDANDPHGCRGTIARLACMWMIAQPAHMETIDNAMGPSTRTHADSTGLITVHGGSDPPPPVATVRCIASLPLTAWSQFCVLGPLQAVAPSPTLTAWSQRQGLDHMTTVH